MLNTNLISEKIEKGDFSCVKEAIEKSMTEGGQTFEQDIARLIMAGTVERQEGLINSDSPTNLMWRLQNDFNANSKSSLFALPNGTLHEDAGEYSLPPQWRMGQVAQDMPET